uniref:DnaJ homolog subfamily C member 8 n=1 Tax=Cacopsylla melanoneura TaxID=428564 RepID=A0A8D8VB37_9HEMI
MEPPANSTSEDPELFTNFITEVKAIEKRDSVLTSAQQIDRLLKPGSTYRNLNPYEVLQLDPETSLDIAKKQYRKLSFLVHPDKNPEDLEKAQQAFEAVNKAWKTLEDEDSRQKCLSVIQEAKERTDYNIEEKRKRYKKEGKGTHVEEDEPEAYAHSVRVMTLKLFADMERKRRDLDTRAMEERKRKREQEIEEEEHRAIEKEWQKNFEESRQNRVESWKQFQSGGSSTKKTKTAKKLKTFRPPRHKAETRD